MAQITICREVELTDKLREVQVRLLYISDSKSPSHVIGPAVAETLDHPFTVDPNTPGVTIALHGRHPDINSPYHSASHIESYITGQGEEVHHIQ